MSKISRFILAIVALFTIGMVIHDPHQAHRPPQLRDAGQPVAAVGLTDL